MGLLFKTILISLCVLMVYMKSCHRKELVESLNEMQIKMAIAYQRNLYSPLIKQEEMIIYP